MRRALLPVLLLLAAAAPAADDPYLWLEEVEGARALDQVKSWNAETERALTASPSFDRYRARAKDILDDERQIAMPAAVLGDRVTNLWRDAKNPRGLWRIASLASYRSGKPEWRTLIDIDALGKAEGESWVWHGADCLAPDYRRCLVSLSPGGTDADVVREFDLETGRFVPGGFEVPLAKSAVVWVDADTLLVAYDEGPDSLTTSGYPRVARLWKRGTPLGQARAIFTGDKPNTSIDFFTAQDGSTRRVFLSRGKSFWTRDYYAVTADGHVGKLPIPEHADMQDVLDGRAVVRLNKAVGGLPVGALAAWSLTEPNAAPELVMAPTARQALEEVSASDTVLWVKALDDVSGALFALTRDADGRWTSKRIPLARNNTVHLIRTAGKSDLAFVSVEGMLTPPSLHAVTPNGTPTLVQSLPARFDAKQFTVEQRFATSKDGTRVPYFLVRKRGVSGPVPALIHGYGGFRAAQTPTYLTEQPYRAGPLGLFWAEAGNAYVLANLRGGGEYGPRWHEAALREKRQVVFDDLHAVAEDLVRTGVSSTGRIAISGRSNGGVTVGVAANQRPDLYGAVISGSPLGDMQRYTKLLAGSLWIDEYGDPEKPDQWRYLSGFSPYETMRQGVRYPPTFYYTSTKDDRVHPGHARKMAARMKEYGNTIYYHEYLEGGHSIGADHGEDAVRAALLTEFLLKELPR